MCFFKHSWELRRLRPEPCESIVRHVEGQWREKEIRGPRSAVVFPCLAQGTHSSALHWWGFLVGISRSGQNLGFSWHPPEKGGRLCVYSCNPFVGPFSTCFFHTQIRDVYVYVCIYSATRMRILHMCLYANKRRAPPPPRRSPCVLHCHSAQHRGRICRKTLQQGHRCPRLMNMQLWHLKLFSRFHSPFLHGHQFPSNYKDVSNRHCWFQAACHQYFLK